MQLNMGGTAFYVAIVSMMLAHTYGVDIDFMFCVQFFFVQLLVAPTGIGLIAMPAIFAAFDIPWMAVAMVVGIEPLLDMFGTAHSVAEDIATSFIVCRNEKKVDEAVYLAQ
jgi:Na+/H+-dicarboxylate symporter